VLIAMLATDRNGDLLNGISASRTRSDVINAMVLKNKTR
jgi:phosphoheptose isomerase